MSIHKTIGVVIPTCWEAKEVLKRYGFKRSDRELYRTEMNNRTILVCISGIGRQAANQASDRLVNAGAQELVSMGFCGALIPELKSGDLVTDRIATVDQAVLTPTARQMLTQKANAIAVDMETQAVVETGTRRGVPIRILRVVSDEVNDDLSPLFGQKGIISWWRMAARLLSPKAWPLALKLRKQSKLASHRLADELNRI